MESAKIHFRKFSDSLASRLKNFSTKQKVIIGAASSYLLYKCYKSATKKQKSVKDKIVFITGAANGIGKALAQRFAKKGARVVIADIDYEKALELANSLISQSFQAIAVKCDVTDIESIKEAASITRNHFGHPSILINNAGIANKKLLINLEIAEMKRCLEINLLSQFYTIKEFLPNMLSDDEGHIVSISSALGNVSIPFLSDYCASKFGVVGLMESFRRELKCMGANIRTTLVQPGFIKTDLINKEHYPIAMDLDYAVDIIFEAILDEKSVLCFPVNFRILNYLKSLLSSESNDFIMCWFFKRSIMTKFIFNEWREKYKKID